MAAQTEAACLLDTGALYARRLLLRPDSGEPIFAGLKTGAFSLYFGDAPIYHFDLDGRWQRAFADGLHYLKGLDGTTQVIDRVREGKNLVLKRRTLSYAESTDFDARVRAEALGLLDRLGGNDLSRVEPPAGAQPLSGEELRTFLERITDWDAAAWFAHRERYLGTYGPLPFLPPDAPHPVVLQATLGHAGGLSFGGGAVHEHYVLTPVEFEEHARAVAALYGRRLEQCKSVFLAGSDVLHRPEEDVAAYLETIRRVFPGLDGVHAFLDDFRTSVSDVAWRRFAALGLRRVALGVESGAPNVRVLYGKTWSDEELRSLVSNLEGAGTGISLLTLVGAGGSEYAERHVEATTSLLNGLALAVGDLISLLDAREVAAEDARDPGSLPAFTPLTDAAWAEQQALLKARLAPLRAERGAKVVPYSLEKQG